MNTTAPITCREFVELVTEYFDGTLAPAEVERFDQHVADCFWCQRYLEQMRTTITVVGRIEEDDISPEAKAELLHVFRDWNAGRA